MPKENILHKVRTAIGRRAGQHPEPPPPLRLRLPETSVTERVDAFCRALEALGGKTLRVSRPQDACEYAGALAGDGRAIASNAPILRECGITRLPWIRTGVFDRAELRELCASASLGITGADYALADTGTLVLLSSPEEARLISLLPPAHLAVVARDKILSGLDELFSVLPAPADVTSSMVLITGPSRTADIEQILIRGVHGPGEIHAVIV